MKNIVCLLCLIFAQFAVAETPDVPNTSLPDAPVVQKQKPHATKSEKTAYAISLGWYAAGSTADVLSTRGAIERGGHELNPLLTRFGNKNARGVIPLLIGGYAAGYFIDRYFWTHGHRKKAIALNFIFGSVSMGFALHNQLTVCPHGCRGKP